MSSNGADGGNASLDGVLSVNGVSDESGKRQPRAVRRTRNTGRHWDGHGSQHESLTPKQDAIDSVASIILSKIDEQSYEHAAWEDADRVMQKHVLPKSLPWSKPRVPLLRSLPRDIEDLQGVWHASEDIEGDVYRRNINSGLLGYGMFDMGGLCKDVAKGIRADTIIASKLSIGSDTPLSPARTRRTNSIDEPGVTKEEIESPSECSDTLTAAARRSDDPGIIELTVKLPLPSLTSCLLKCQRHKILPYDPWLKHDKKSIHLAKSILAAERAELCSSMPLYWDKLDNGTFQEPPAFVDLKEIGFSNDIIDESIYGRMKKREQRKRKIEELSNACTRKWKISVKVTNASSRSNLTRPERKPMCLMAELPSYVQHGQSLTIESASIKDKEEGLRNSLGSYDCRATAMNTGMSFHAMDNVGAKPTSGRSKRISVGRTRLIWTEASTKYSKPIFSCLFTGEKLDAAAYKRPRDIKVSVVLNGKLLCDTADEESDQKRDRGNIFTDKFTWSKNKVQKAIIVAGDSIFDSAVIKANVNDKEKQYFPDNAQCTLEAEDYFDSVVKSIKGNAKGKPNQEIKDDDPLDLVSEISIGPGELAPSYARPKFNCLPLDDGYLRTHCNKPGTLKGSTKLPKFLSSVSSKNSDDSLCTVCWTGSETYKVLACLKCGLLCHQDCCLDGGAYETNRNQDIAWICAVCKVMPYYEYLPKKVIYSPSNNISRSGKSCELSSDISAKLTNACRKSQRRSRLPTRFKENEEEKRIAISAACTSASPFAIDPTLLVNTITPKCTLCPHSGGAMSITNKDTSRWTHEVCRIWCNEVLQDASSNPNPNPPNASGIKVCFQDSVCCLCGMGKIHNEFDEKEEALIAPSSSHSSSAESMGLIKCAATNCTITFHPMCALLSTKLAPEHLESQRRKVKKSSPDVDDTLLCQRYSLDLVEVSRQEGGDGIGGHAEDKTFIVPVGFCGLHNSERAEDMYGLLPKDSEQTKMISDLMYIPYQFDQ